MVWLDNSTPLRVIKPAGGYLSLITASLLLTAVAATQPAGKSNGHLNSQSISRSVSLVWLRCVSYCQAVGAEEARSPVHRSCSTTAASSHSKPARDERQRGRLAPLNLLRPAFHKSNTQHLFWVLSLVLLTDKTERKPFNIVTSPLQPVTFEVFINCNNKSKQKSYIDYSLNMFTESHQLLFVIGLNQQRLVPKKASTLRSVSDSQLFQQKMR